MWFLRHNINQSRNDHHRLEFDIFCNKNTFPFPISAHRYHHFVVCCCDCHWFWNGQSMTVFCYIGFCEKTLNKPFHINFKSFNCSSSNSLYQPLSLRRNACHLTGVVMRFWQQRIARVFITWFTQHIDPSLFQQENFSSRSKCFIV